MNREAVDENGVTLLDGGLAEALQQDKDTGCLGIVEARVVTYHDIVEKDVNVWYFVGMERCYDHV